MKLLPNSQDGALQQAAIYHVGLFLVCLLLSFFDTRQVMGINPWIKPMKFCLSIALYLYTLSVYLAYVEGFEALRLWIGRIVATLMYIEIAAVTIQAARGVMSHYNISSPMDGSIFAVMGIAIGINSVLDAVVFGLLLLAPGDLRLATLWGMRFGMIIFIAAGFEGGLMLMNQGHTIGAPDGGAGLPFVNWSREHGDLRVAHFLGLHGIQILPLLGLVLDSLLGNVYVRAGLISACSLGYGALMWWQTKLALAGKPFFRS
ncbi:hypothetical protein F183_A53380 [Bryobacterales bacterium F-183]|nr:hypothetical protein F183_A53380 [Bryobacterales bacterium F-183]